MMGKQEGRFSFLPSYTWGWIEGVGVSFHSMPCMQEARKADLQRKGASLLIA